MAVRPGIRLLAGLLLVVALTQGAALAQSAASQDEPLTDEARLFAAPTTRDHIGRIVAPVMVAVGTTDKVAGNAQELAALIPGARALDIPGRDHMLAVGDKVFKAGVIDFLNSRP